MTQLQSPPVAPPRPADSDVPPGDPHPPRPRRPIRWGRVAAWVVMAILIVVTVLDQISNWLRKRLV